MIDYSSDKPKYILYNAHIYKLVESEKEIYKVYLECFENTELIRECIISGEPKYITHNAHTYKIVNTEKELRKAYNDCVKTNELIREEIMKCMFINKEKKE